MEFAGNELGVPVVIGLTGLGLAAFATWQISRLPTLRERLPRWMLPAVLVLIATGMLALAVVWTANP
jgi:hypothetical protein